MKISIACCTFNGENYLLDQLQSFSIQSRLPDELIICDDHSTDSTLDIVAEFAKSAPFQIKVLTNKSTPLGSTKNFERAITNCSGDIIVLSDQDDVWYPNKLFKLEQVFQEGAGLVFSDADLVDGNLKSLGYSLFEASEISRNEAKLIAEKSIKDVLLKRDIVTGATAAFSSKHLPLILPISDLWVHDGWIATLIAFVDKVELLQEPLLMYRQHYSNQIGARKLSFKERQIKQRKLGKNHQAKLLRGYKAAFDRLLSHSPESVTIEDMQKFNDKLAHLSKRALVAQPSLLTPIFLTTELVLGHYHKYARGWMSYFRDMMLLYFELLSFLKSFKDDNK